jgi:hypothetical protein
MAFDPKSIVLRIGVDETRLDSICAANPGVERDSLLKQLSLHLPRMPLHDTLDVRCVLREAERLAVRLAILQRDYSQVASQRPQCHVRDLQFASIEEAIAKPLLERFHYLLSHRRNSLHFGLLHPDAGPWPLAMVSLSAFDLRNMNNGSAAIPLNPVSTIVISRVYAVQSAPANSISYLFGRLRRWLIDNQPEVTTLLTYLNPNIGFSGSSYEADNWTLYGEERDTRYVYVDLDYKTDRYLAEKFGTANVEELRVRLGHRVSTSLFPLQPLRVYARRTSNEPIDQGTRSFSRWIPDFSERDAV